MSRIRSIRRRRRAARVQRDLSRERRRSTAHIPTGFRGRRLKQIKPFPTVDDQILSTPGVTDRSPLG